jgi:hypothetical protein
LQALVDEAAVAKQGVARSAAESDLDGNEPALGDDLQDGIVVSDVHGPTTTIAAGGRHESYRHEGAKKFDSHDAFDANGA